MYTFYKLLVNYTKQYLVLLFFHLKLYSDRRPAYGSEYSLLKVECPMYALIKCAHSEEFAMKGERFSQGISKWWDLKMLRWNRNPPVPVFRGITTLLWSPQATKFTQLPPPKHPQSLAIMAYTYRANGAHSPHVVLPPELQQQLTRNTQGRQAVFSKKARSFSSRSLLKFIPVRLIFKCLL